MKSLIEGDLSNNQCSQSEVTDLMKLPNNDKVQIPAAKVRDYLLSLTIRMAATKARFFMSFGFTPGRWQQLADALREHALANGVAQQKQTPFGIKWVVEGPLLTPDGRNPMIRVVWFARAGTTPPRLVTAYPL